MANGESFSYKLFLTDSAGTLSGYSLTFPVPDETKATVKAKLNRELRTLSFKEIAIEYSHGFMTKAFMCMVNAKLEYVHSDKGYVLTGPLTSAQADKTSCTPGTITFAVTEELRDLFTVRDAYDTVISMKKKPKQPEVYTPPAPVAAPIAPLTTDEVTAGIEKAYTWNSDTIGIDVWDGGNTDGDRITLMLNGQALLTNYFIVKQKKHLRIPMPPGNAVNTLAIIAEYEGSDPPNTANMLLTDGAHQYSILAYNKKGNQAIIKIRRAKKP